MFMPHSCEVSRFDSSSQLPSELLWRLAVATTLTPLARVGLTATYSDPQLTRLSVSSGTSLRPENRILSVLQLLFCFIATHAPHWAPSCNVVLSFTREACELLSNKTKQTTNYACDVFFIAPCNCAKTSTTLSRPCEGLKQLFTEKNISNQSQLKVS